MTKPANCLRAILSGAPARRAALSAWLLAMPAMAANAAGAIGAANAAQPPHRTVTIVIEAMAFSPQMLEVHTGDTVIWRNQDPFPHTVSTQVRGGFSSPEIAPGETWKLIVSDRGIFPYICTLHTTMKGSLSVK